MCIYTCIYFCPLSDQFCPQFLPDLGGAGLGRAALHPPSTSWRGLGSSTRTWFNKYLFQLYSRGSIITPRVDVEPGGCLSPSPLLPTRTWLPIPGGESAHSQTCFPWINLLPPSPGWSSLSCLVLVAGHPPTHSEMSTQP